MIKEYNDQSAPITTQSATSRYTSVTIPLHLNLPFRDPRREADHSIGEEQRPGNIHRKETAHGI